MTLDLSDLQGRQRELEQFYATLRSRWEEDETYYKGTFTYTLPDGVNKVVPARGYNAVETAATHIVTDKPVVQRRRDIHGKRGQSHDDAVEAFQLAFLQDNDEQCETPPLHEGVKLQLLRGLAVLHGPLFDRQKWKDEEEGALWYDAVDPKLVLLPPGPMPRDGFLVAEMSEEEMAQLADEQPKFKSWERSSANTKVTLVEWYGFADAKAQYCTYAAWEKNKGGWLVEPRLTGYKYLPFIRIYSGYGLRTRGAAPEDIAVPILTEQVKTLLIDHAYALSVCSAIMGNAAWNRLAVTSEALKNQVQEDFQPGSVSVRPPGTVVIESPNIPAAVLQHYSNISGELDQALYSGVVSGQRPEGVNTASGLVMLSGQARLKFGPPLRLLEVGVAKLLGNLGLLLESLEEWEGIEEFEIRGRKIRVADFDGDYSVKVKLLAEDPEERNARIARGVTLSNQISEKRKYEDFFGIENWEEDVKQRLYERLILGDEMYQTLAQYLQLQQGQQPPQLGPAQQPGGASGMAQLGTMNAAAKLFRQARPGTEQQRALPGSPEAMQQQVRQQVAMPTGQTYGR